MCCDFLFYYWFDSFFREFKMRTLWFVRTTESYLTSSLFFLTTSKCDWMLLLLFGVGGVAPITTLPLYPELAKNFTGQLTQKSNHFGDNTIVKNEWQIDELRSWLCSRYVPYCIINVLLLVTFVCVVAWYDDSYSVSSFSNWFSHVILFYRWYLWCCS